MGGTLLKVRRLTQSSDSYAIFILFCLLAALTLVEISAEAAPPASEGRGRFLVVLDPGHGGADAGTLYRRGKTRLTEKQLTLLIAKETAALLMKAGVPTILTRSDDGFLELDQRSAIANRAEAAVFISLHVNSSPHGADHGIETYVLNTATNATAGRLAEIENGRGHHTPVLSLILSDLETTANYQDSVELACAVQGGLYKGLRKGGMPVRDRGVRQALFYVLMQTHMPSILVELGFASNPVEGARLARKAYRSLMTRSLAAAILEYKRQWLLGPKSGRSPERAALSAIEKRGRRGLCLIR